MIIHQNKTEINLLKQGNLNQKENNMKQQNEITSEREQLMQNLYNCEKLISDCSINQFSDLRFELKQLKEKLRLLNHLSRMK